MMNILLQSRINLFSKPGGDTSQILSLREGLNKKGLNAEISTQLKPDLDTYHIVHLFNITRVHETYIQMINAKNQGKPTVCSAIYHDLEEYNRKGRYGPGKTFFKLVKNDKGFEYARGLFNALRDRRQVVPVFRQWKTGYRAQQEAVLKYCDKIIFGAPSEKDMVFSRFNAINDLIDYDIIKIGISQSFQNPDSRPFEKKYGLKDFILCVGRIEDLKNQLGLISAMRGVDIPTVLIGSLNPAHQNYCRKILKQVEKRQNLYYFGHMEKEMLSSAFAAAKVHVLPSWFETTGLTSLEAGIAGCSVVSTNRGYARDYLEDFAWYCDPSDLLSIRNAVTDAFFSPGKPGMKEHIKNNLDPEKTVTQSFKLYQEVLSGCKGA